MRAATYTGARTFTVQESSEVPPGPGEVSVEVAFTGICGTDLHIFHGDMDGRVSRPAVIGHEMSGRVAALGAGVEGWSVGDLVTVLPVKSCGECPACVAGNSHVCMNLVFIGIDAPGAMQGRWTVPADLLVALPEGVSLEHAALVEPTAVAVHDVRRSGLVKGETAVVVGGGPVGLLIATVAANAGGDVVVIELDPYRRSVAESIGLRTLDPSSEDVTTYITAATGGAGAAVAFEVSGAAGGVTHRGGGARRTRPVGDGRHPLPAAGDQPAPVLLARADDGRRPALRPVRLRDGRVAGRQRGRSRPTP